MSKSTEEKMIDSTNYPLTIQSLADKLRACGMARGQTVAVHLAMSKLGWVIGGAEAVIRAFLAVLGEEGTLIMPTHTTNNTDPGEWRNPPVPESWHQLIRNNTPAYRPEITTTRMMGAVPELFRTWPGVIRSQHPVGSFAAIGPNADYLTSDHALEEDTGNRSPVGRLYELDGYVMLLGVVHWNNTSLHLAEFRATYPGKRNMQTGSAMIVQGQRQWVQYQTLHTYGGDFGEIGEAFDEAHPVTVHQIAQAEVRFFKQRAVVDFAVEWMTKNRDLRER